MPAPQSTQEKAVDAPLPTSPDLIGAPGSLVWTLNTMFELGNRIPIITCCRLPIAGNAGACDEAEAVACGAEPGSTIVFSAASSEPSSVRAAGNLPTLRRCATKSADWAGVSLPGSSAGMVLR